MFVPSLGAYAGAVVRLFPHGSYAITVAILPLSRSIELGPLLAEVAEVRERGRYTSQLQNSSTPEA